MPQCEHCGREVDLPFECKFCGKYYCLEHRLPESHNCPNLPPKTPLGGWQTKKEMAIAHAEEKRGKFVSEGELHFIKEGGKSEKKEVKKPFPTKKVVGICLVVLVIGFLIWCASIFIFNMQNHASTEDYVQLTLRDSSEFEVDPTVIEFGDTEYTFDYHFNTLWVSAPFQRTYFTPIEGKTYRDFGIEIKVSKVASDYISDYIVILVKPIVNNYMASLYYTKVNITLYETKAVNISSGLINKTNQYWFTYIQVEHPTFVEPKLRIRTTSQSKEYYISTWTVIREFEIEVKVYKIESNYVVIYVKPLY